MEVGATEGSVKFFLEKNVIHPSFKHGKGFSIGHFNVIEEAYEFAWGEGGHK